MTADRTAAYSASEQRVANYITEITKENVGGGADPVGFLIASHAALIAERRSTAKEADRSEALKDALAAIGHADSVGEAEQRILDLIEKVEDGTAKEADELRADGGKP